MYTVIAFHNIQSQGYENETSNSVCTMVCFLKLCTEIETENLVY
jgi:hypothetical protein